MRPKIVVGILLAGVFAIGAIILLKPHSAAPVPEVVPPAAKAAPAPEPAPLPTPAPAVEVKRTLTPEEHEAAIDAEVDRLSAWSMNDDPQSLSNILKDLTSPDKEIRTAAIEAAKQFESTNAIPALKAAAANAEDNQEATEMLEAADWLALPTVDLRSSGPPPQLTPEQAQAIEKGRAEAKARHDAYMQTHHPQVAPGSDSTPPPNQNPPTGSTQ